MKIYLAGGVGLTREKRNSLFYTRRLFSFFYIYFDPARAEAFNWLVSYTKGKEENID